MTALDYLIIAIVLVFAIVGFLRGLVAGIFSLLAWVAALFIGARYGELAAPLVEWLGSPKHRAIAASLLVGIGAYVIVSVIGALLSETVRISIFAPINRMLGLLFGAACGCIVVGVAVLLGLQFGLQDAEWWKSARLRPVALTAADIIDSAIDFAPFMRKQELLDFSKLPL
jgi:membrane protein required for colicin V production